MIIGQVIIWILLLASICIFSTELIDIAKFIVNLECFVTAISIVASFLWYRLLKKKAHNLHIVIFLGVIFLPLAWLTSSGAVWYSSILIGFIITMLYYTLAG
ncbi:MAG: hypothetical protein J1F31_05910 [Erysipelotrichales bacterium]|nr:hypothetical protein [Erysipelotrichales bacterium]